MNIFVLDYDPIKAAEYNCDRHVLKIILEATEMMGFTYDDKKFKPLPWISHNNRHYMHPFSRWVRESVRNFDWTLQHTQALLNEYTFRYNKIHSYQTHLDWISNNLPIANLQEQEQTDWPRCFGTYKEQIELSDDAVWDYRQYYIVAKRHLAIWTKRPVPFWYH